MRYNKHKHESNVGSEIFGFESSFIVILNTVSGNLKVLSSLDLGRYVRLTD